MDEIDIAQQVHDEIDRPARRRCLATGCTCMDLRIVSPRRATFYAHQAEGRGQTAQRVIASDPGWRLPVSARTTELWKEH